MSTYFSIPTEIGEARIANALALGIPLKLTHMAVGDGNGVVPAPDRKQTALVKEQRRAPINTLDKDPKNPSQIIIEQVLPADVGGWWVREIGIFDDAGNLCAVANCPPSYKPLLADGAGKDQVVRVVLLVASTAAVELKIDPAVVLATRKYADDAVTAHEQKADPHPQYVVTREKVVTLLGEAAEANQGIVRLATNDEAEAGTDDTKAMTPLKVFKAIAKKLVQATEAVMGAARIATQAQVTAGTDDATIVTPKKLRAGFSSYYSVAGGYFIFPTWLGGLILQWGQGYVSSTAGAATGWAFPIAFPTTLLALTISNANGYSAGVVSVNSTSVSGFNAFSSAANTNITWFAIGR